MTAIMTALGTGYLLGVVSVIGGLVIAAAAIWKDIR